MDKYTPDLTRFTFQAKKWYCSETVRALSADECGQYILLLVEAWMSGKAASLPTDTSLLAKYARVKQVSRAVLACFPIVDTEFGKRRRNETLYKDWVESVTRSETAAKKANARWDKRQSPSNATALPQHDASNAQENSIQINSNQPNTTANSVVVSEAFVKVKNFTKLCVPIWQKYFGEGAILRLPNMSKDDIEFLTTSYPIDKLLEAFDLFAKDSFDNGLDSPFAVGKFVSKVADYMKRISPLKVSTELDDRNNAAAEAHAARIPRPILPVVVITPGKPTPGSVEDYSDIFGEKK